MTLAQEGVVGGAQRVGLQAEVTAAGRVSPATADTMATLIANRETCVSRTPRDRPGAAPNATPPERSPLRCNLATLPCPPAAPRPRDPRRPLVGELLPLAAEVALESALVGPWCVRGGSGPRAAYPQETRRLGWPAEAAWARSASATSAGSAPGGTDTVARPRW